MSKVVRFMEQWEASIEKRKNEPQPAGPRLKAATIFIWRMILVGSVVFGACFLDLNFFSDQAVAVLFGILIAAWLVVDVWTRRVAWVDADIHRWVAIMLIAGTALGLASFMLTYNGIEKHRLARSVIQHSSIAGTLDDSMRALMLREYGGEVSSKYGLLSPLHGEKESRIEIQFKDAETCRDILTRHTPATAMLSAVELGDEFFDGWPRKQMLVEHCAEKVKLTYSRGKS